jgi:hypothetical protein
MKNNYCDKIFPLKLKYFGAILAKICTQKKNAG